MAHIRIQLNSIHEVKAFVRIVSGFDCEVDLSSGRYVVDAKSIMGIFSLDLTQPLDLEIRSDDPEPLIRKLRPYIKN